MSHPPSKIAVLEGMERGISGSNPQTLTIKANVEFYEELIGACVKLIGYTAPGGKESRMETATLHLKTHKLVVNLIKVNGGPKYASIK